jgi:hypothetical protein
MIKRPHAVQARSLSDTGGRALFAHPGDPACVLICR